MRVISTTSALLEMISTLQANPDLSYPKSDESPKRKKEKMRDLMMSPGLMCL